MSFIKNSYEFSKQNKNSFIGNKRLSSQFQCHQYKNSQNDLIDLTSSDIERNKIHKNLFNNFCFEKNITSNFLSLNNEDRNGINTLNQNYITSTAKRNNFNRNTYHDQQNIFNGIAFNHQHNSLNGLTFDDHNFNINGIKFQNQNNNINGITINDQNNNFNAIPFNNQNNNFNAITFQNQQITIHNQNISNNFNEHKCNNIYNIPKTNSNNDCFIDLTNTSNKTLTQINNDNRINLTMTKSQNSINNVNTQFLDKRNIHNSLDSKKIYSGSDNNSDDQKIEKLLQTCTIPKLKVEQFYIYILKCESDKFYVGKSSNLKKRLENHVIKRNCQWTKKYEPLSIEEIIISDDSFDEDKWVKKYMIKKGINNVRGGSYCQLRLSNIQINAIVNEIVHSRGCCFYCFEDNHLTCRKRYRKDFNKRYMNKILDEILTQGFSNKTENPIFKRRFDNSIERKESNSPCDEETDIIIDINNVEASNDYTEGNYEENSDNFLSE